MASPYFSLLQSGAFPGLKERLNRGGFTGGTPAGENVDNGVGPVRFDETTGGWTGVNFPTPPPLGGQGQVKGGRGLGGVVPRRLPPGAGLGRGFGGGMAGGNMPTPPLGGGNIDIGVGAPTPGIIGAPMFRGDQGMTGGNPIQSAGPQGTRLQRRMGSFGRGFSGQGVY